VPADREQLLDLGTLGVATAALLIAGLIGAGLAIVVAGSQTLRAGVGPQAQPAGVGVVQSGTSAAVPVTVAPTSVPQADIPVRTAVGPSSAGAAAAPAATLAGPRVTTATPLPTPVPTLEPTPTVAQAWAELQPDLDSVWGQDTPRTIALLNGFVARFADFAPAREKLYAALIASGVELARAGETDAAEQQFGRARALMPERGEAAATAQALTPTPTEAPAVANVSQPSQAIEPARAAPTPVRAPPPNPARAVVPPAPATPTKQPFRPPGGA
jgi:hypothetical protein